MSGTAVPAELEAELDGVPWMFPWRLADGRRVPIHGEWIVDIHHTRLEIMEPVLRPVLEAAGPDASVLDLACNEGWIGHRMLDWGAGRVVGVDIRDLNIRRARLMRDHLGVPAERLEFHQADALELDVEALGGPFDVVLVLGLVYHMERPIDAMRVARRACRTVCAIDSLLSVVRGPVLYGRRPGLRAGHGCFGLVIEDAGEADNLSAAPGRAALVPDRTALVAMTRLAGFSDIVIAPVAGHHDQAYVTGGRVIAIARP